MISNDMAIKFSPSPRWMAPHEVPDPGAGPGPVTFNGSTGGWEFTINKMVNG